jgi:UDP-N-acetylglucosamine 2-epimerase
MTMIITIIGIMGDSNNVAMMPAFSNMDRVFFDQLKLHEAKYNLEKGARLVLTDSDGVQEESIWDGKAAENNKGH